MAIGCIFFVAVLLFQPFKVSVGLVNGFRKGKGVIVFVKYGVKVEYLMVVYHAQQNRLFIVGKAAYTVNLGAAVLKSGKYLSGNLIPVGGNNGKLAGRLCSLKDVVSDKAGYKAIENTKANGLVVKYQSTCFVGACIYKKGGSGNNGVKNKGYPKEVKAGLMQIYILGNNIRTARRRPVLKAHAVNKARYNAAKYYGVYGVVSLGNVLKSVQPNILQKQKAKGVGKAKAKGAHSKFAPYKEKRKNTKRYVYKQRHITYAEPCFVLHHGGNTVKPCRRKAVFYNKKLIVKRQKYGAKYNFKVNEYGFKLHCQPRNKK